MTDSEPKNVVLAMTGASGAIFAVRLLDVLVAAGCRVQLTISPSARVVLKQELDVAIDLDRFNVESLLGEGERGEGLAMTQVRRLLGPRFAAGRQTRTATKQVVYHHHQNLLASIASGSSRTDGMVICPCSGGTLSALATAASSNLIHRAAEVHLKERRKLVLVPRETPLSMIQLDNMRRVTEAGAVVLPAMPGWYHGVESIGDLVDFVVARICDQLGVDNALVRRWGEPS